MEEILLNQLLQMSGIQKSFPGVHALDDAQLDLVAGEVHALVGENGAGKSTLMKILSGIYTKDAGVIKIDGEPVELNNIQDATRLGIQIIHQEINLMQDLTVAENIWIGREPMRGIFIDRKKQNADTAALLEKFHLTGFDPATKVAKLSVAKQQMIEIAKALSFEATRIMIMDEPTAALADSEINELFDFIADLKQHGVGIIYISHRLEELRRIADRVTVMRDGKYVATHPMADVTMDQIIDMMVGRTIYEKAKTTTAVAENADVVLKVEHLTSKDVQDVSFELKRGEILGIAGLMGAGRTEAVRLICGADPKDAGEIIVNGKPVKIKTPADAVKAGIGYLSEDRKRFGLCLGLSVADNTVMASLDQFMSGIFLNDREIKTESANQAEKIQTKMPSVDVPVKSLSGGNQQKVIISKWLLRDCDILIFDEPTRGIDVGAKGEIYKLMNQLVAAGKSIIMISSEMPELLRMSDRIIVMCEGRLTGELPIEAATQEKIMTLATGGK